MDIDKALNSKVSWKVFTWTIGIILIMFGTTFTMIGSAMQKVEGYNADIIEIKIGVQEIKTTNEFILKGQGELKSSLDNHLTR